MLKIFPCVVYFLPLLKVALVTEAAKETDTKQLSINSFYKKTSLREFGLQEGI